MLWKRLGLGSLLAELLDESEESLSGRRGRRQEVPDSLIAALIAVNRLVAPTSEWGMLDWLPETALPALLGIPLSKVTDFRRYHCLDAVHAHKEAIEDHLAQRGQELLGRDDSFLLYDLSSTYFEGQAEKNPQAKRGYSRDHRPDAKQVCAGFVTDRHGYGVGLETWRGNIQDHQTLSTALDQLEARFGPPHDPDQPDKPRRIVVMDRGMTTDKTVPELRRRGYRYVLAERRGEVRKHWGKIDPEGWLGIRRNRKTGEPLVEVQAIGREEGDRLIVVRSAGARQKEQGIHERFLGRLKDPNKIERKVGRLQERYPGVSRWVAVELREGEAGRELAWWVKPEAEDEARAFEGVYLLRTNVEDISAQEVWEHYILLERMEKAIRTLKHDLKLRPVFHQLEPRVEAHLFFTFLAYDLLWALEWVHRHRGGELTGRRVIDVLHQITASTLRLTTTEGQPLRLERIDVPTREQAEVLATVDISLPKPRLRLEPLQLSLREVSSCGGGRIRTFEAREGLTVFKTAPFNRSGTPPY